MYENFLHYELMIQRKELNLNSNPFPFLADNKFFV